MTTYHAPNSAGPGTYLPLAEFKAFWGDKWQLARDEVDAQVADVAAEIAWNTSISWQAYWDLQFEHAGSGADAPLYFGQVSKAINQALLQHPYAHDRATAPKLPIWHNKPLPKATSERPMHYFVPNEKALSKRWTDLMKYQVYTPPAGWQLVVSKVATTAIQTVAVGAVTGGLLSAASSIGSAALSNVIGADNLASLQQTFGNIEGAIDSAQSFGDAIGDFLPAAPPSAKPPQNMQASAEPQGPSEPMQPASGGAMLVVGIVALLALALLEVK